VAARARDLAAGRQARIAEHRAAQAVSWATLGGAPARQAQRRGLDDGRASAGRNEPERPQRRGGRDGAKRARAFADRIGAGISAQVLAARVQSSAALRSPIGGRPCASSDVSRSCTPGSCGSDQRCVMKRAMEPVSYGVWSTKPRRANGEMITAGMRVPGPTRSPLGGATSSHWPPFSS
jgi:hypothetical protein